MPPTPIPQAIEFKPAFEERYRLLLGPRYEEFIRFSSTYIRKCIRVNTLKIAVPELRARLTRAGWALTPVPWCPEGFWIEKEGEERFDIGNIPEHQLGYFYIQEAASMIPPVVLAPEPGDRVLDLCAAPGSKTTQLAQYLRNQGLLVANDVDWSRLKPLGLNLMRCGVTNTAVVLKANNRLPEAFFDKVLVDAPCSGTGTIRRSLKTMRMWSPGLVARMTKDQRRLIRLGYALLKPGGVMVYSTCSQEPEENEGVLSWFLEREPGASLETFSLGIVRSPPVEEWGGKRFHPAIGNVLRIYPQDNDTEGFFVAKIRKSVGASDDSSSRDEGHPCSVE